MVTLSVMNANVAVIDLPLDPVTDPTSATAANVEAFSRAFVETGSWGAAYRRVFQTRQTPDRTLWNRSYEFAQRQDVRNCIAKMLDDSRKAAIISVNQLLDHLATIARANPALLTWITVHACRHCHGMGGAYQWRDYDEWAIACSDAFAGAVKNDASSAAGVRLPTDEGGFGYTMHRAPNPECESCAGAGLRVTHVQDRDKMQPAELKLFKGVKQKADGSIEVLMHDQLRAAEMVGRILGAFNDKLSIIPPAKVAELPPGTTAAEVQSAYLSMVSGT